MLYITALSAPSSAFEILITIRRSLPACNVPCHAPVRSCASKELFGHKARAAINTSTFDFMGTTSTSALVFILVDVPGSDHSRGLGGITATHGKVPFFLIGRLKTLSPDVTYSVC